MAIAKRWVVVVALVLVPALWAFGGGQSEGGQAGEETVTLRIWDQFSEEGPSDAIEEIIARFEEKHPGVEVQREVMQMDDLRSAAKTAIASGQGPDLLGSSIGPFTWPLIEAGLVEDLSAEYADRGWDARLQPWAAGLTRYNGKFWAVPNEAEVMGVFYHKDIFADQGISEPESYSEFVDAAMALKGEDYEPVIALGGLKLWLIGWLESVVYGSAITDEQLRAVIFERQSWEQSEFLRAIEMIKELNDQELLPQSVNAVGYDEMKMLFYSKRAPIMVAGSWIIPEVAALDDVDVGYMPLPSLPGIESRAVKNAGSGWLLSSESENKELALEFLDEVISLDSERTWVNTGKLFPPTRFETTDGLELSPLQSEVLDALNTPTAAYSLFNVLPEDVNQATWSSIQAMFLGRATPEEVVEAKETAWQIAIEEGRVPER
jgi:raffinose/stachyose/melibiose transport system substrate-binding protein